MVKRKGASKERNKSTRQVATSGKSRLVLRKLIFFGILFVLSFVIYNAVSTALYVNLFFLLSLIFGVICAALILVYLILFFLKSMKK
jgi:hypothetical protein